MEVKIASIDNLKDIQLLNKGLFEEEFDKYDQTINVDWPLSEEGADFYKKRIMGDDGYASLSR
tara:strand:- start:153 stop:341 length:189 start_codon:yes stop_codon:yes gene_type:complete